MDTFAFGTFTLSIFGAAIAFAVFNTLGATLVFCPCALGTLSAFRAFGALATAITFAAAITFAVAITFAAAFALVAAFTFAAALNTKQSVGGHTKYFCNLGQHGYIGAGYVVFPLAYCLR